MSKANPLVKRLTGMSYSEVENFARNMCKERGVDFDTEFKKFMEGINKACKH